MPKKKKLPRYVCRQSGLEQTDCASTKLDLLATFKTLNVARIAQSETRGQNWIQRQFRGETKPSKHRFKPPSRAAHLFESETR